MTATTIKRPKVLVLDVNETLSDLEPMRGRFKQVGLRGPAARRLVRRDAARRLRAHRSRNLPDWTNLLLDGLNRLRALAAPG
jgi:hypothetical protein